MTNEIAAHDSIDRNPLARNVRASPPTNRTDQRPVSRGDAVRGDGHRTAAYGSLGPKIFGYLAGRSGQ